MPANTLFSALPPDIAQQQQQILLQQALANQIQQKANQGPDMQGWNQMRVVPKLSPFAAGGQAGQQLMAALLQRKALQGQVDLNRRMYQAQQDSITRMSQGGGAGGAPAPPDQGASPPPSPPPAGMPIDSGGGTTPLQRGPWAPTPENEALTQAIANQQAPPQGPQAPPQSSGTPSDALSSAFGPAQNAANLNVSPEIIKAYLASKAPTEHQRDVGAAFGNGPEARQVLQHVVAPPTSLRPGGTLVDALGRPTMTAPSGGIQTQWGPNGPTASPVPGYAGAAGQIAGAEAGGKAMNTPQAFETGSGATHYGYPGDVLGTAPSMRGPSAPPPGPPTAGPPQAPLAAAAQQAKADKWASAPKLIMPSGLGAPDEFTKNVLKDSATKHSELSTKYGAEADLADQKLQYNSEALKSLPTAEVGPLSHFLTENRAKLAEVAPSLAKALGQSGTVAPTQELNKNLVNAALQGARAIYGARMTQNEVNLQKNEASPSAAMAPEAIKSLLQQDNARNNYAKQRAQDYAKFRQLGGDPMRFESWYATNFPLKTFAQKQMTPPQALQFLQQHPETLKAFKDKFGWAPGE